MQYYNKSHFVTQKKRDFLPIYENPKYVENVKGLNYTLKPKDRIILFHTKSMVFIYPVKVMEKHEILPLSLNGKEYTLTYCPITDGAIIFKGPWGVSGKLLEGNLILYDKNRKEKLVPQLLGNEIKKKSVIRSTWGTFLKTNKSYRIVNGSPEIKGGYNIPYYEDYHKNENHIYQNLLTDRGRSISFKNKVQKAQVFAIYDGKAVFLKDTINMERLDCEEKDEFLGIIKIKGKVFIQYYAFAHHIFSTETILTPIKPLNVLHKKDKDLKFDNSIDIETGKRKHVYLYKEIDIKKLGWVSVTELKNVFYPFNADFIAFRLSSTRNKKSIYYGKSKKNILKMWEELANLGTEVHKIIEDYLETKKEYKETKFEKEYKQFLRYHKMMLKDGYKPYRTEWKIYNENLKIAGTIDAVYIRKKKMIITDWKRSNKPIIASKAIFVKPEATFYNEELKSGKITHYKDVMKGLVMQNKFLSYSLQLGIYRYILKSSYDLGYSIDEMHLVRIYPDNKENYELTKIDPKNLEFRIEKLFALKKMIHL